MHILFIASWYPNPEKSLSHGIFIQRHAKAISINSRVTVIHFYASNKMQKTITEKGNITEILIPYKKHFIWNSLNTILTFQKLKKKFAEVFLEIEEKYGKLDIIHQNIIFPLGYFSSKLAQKKSIPLLLSEQWSGYLHEDNSYDHFLVKFITRKIVGDTIAITTVSEYLKKAILERGLNANYTVIPNIVDTNLFHLPSVKIKNEIPNLLHVSSLNNTEKNIEVLLKSLYIVKERGHKFILTIIGESNERQGFEKMVKKMGLTQSIKFEGSKTPTELVDYYQQSDFFVLSSNFETFCVVLIEALACGIPIVATNAGAVSEIINSSNGYLAKIKSPQDLAEKIILMLHTFQNFNPVELRNSIVEKYSSNTVSLQFDTIYKKLLNEK